uniref:Uncharacterized protein n=1 Tax=Palpitomonas bilix TaxID=652834 RepID=A0A7S3DAJ5_9EUKA|mmetsp:Transcript_29435/g.75927  ORF Transcript_29435/g.75927 Transcript_29435/m.75927 type:complete len:726 (+) Transcript_29435:358-2535(+)
MSEKRRELKGHSSGRLQRKRYFIEKAQARSSDKRAGSLQLRRDEAAFFEWKGRLEEQSSKLASVLDSLHTIEEESISTCVGVVEEAAANLQQLFSAEMGWGSSALHRLFQSLSTPRVQGSGRSIVVGEGKEKATAEVVTGDVSKQKKDSAVAGRSTGADLLLLASQCVRPDLSYACLELLSVITSFESAGAFVTSVFDVSGMHSLVGSMEVELSLSTAQARLELLIWLSSNVMQLRKVREIAIGQGLPLLLLHAVQKYGYHREGAAVAFSMCADDGSAYVLYSKVMEVVHVLVEEMQCTAMEGRGRRVEKENGEEKKRQEMESGGMRADSVSAHSVGCVTTHAADKELPLIIAVLNNMVWSLTSILMASRWEGAAEDISMSKWKRVVTSMHGVKQEQWSQLVSDMVAILSMPEYLALPSFLSSTSLPLSLPSHHPFSPPLASHVHAARQGCEGELRCLVTTCLHLLVYIVQSAFEVGVGEAKAGEKGGAKSQVGMVKDISSRIAASLIFDGGEGNPSPLSSLFVAGWQWIAADMYQSKQVEGGEDESGGVNSNNVLHTLNVCANTCFAAPVFPSISPSLIPAFIAVSAVMLRLKCGEVQAKVGNGMDKNGEKGGEAREAIEDLEIDAQVEEALRLVCNCCIYMATSIQDGSNDISTFSNCMRDLQSWLDVLSQLSYLRPLSAEERRLALQACFTVTSLVGGSIHTDDVSTVVASTRALLTSMVAG